MKYDISFKLHNFMYLVVDLCEIAKGRVVRGRERDRDMDGEGAKEGFDKIIGMVERFLGESNYEEICDTFSKLNL